MKINKRLSIIIIFCLFAVMLEACGSINLGKNYPAEDNGMEKSAQEPVLNEISNQWGGVQLQWNEVSDSDQYYVYRKTGKEDWQMITSTDMTSFIDDKVENESDYIYAVSINSENDISKSDLDERSKSITYYEGPKDLVVACIPGGINLKWTSDNNIGRFRILKKEIFNGRKEAVDEKDDAVSTPELSSEESTLEMNSDQEKISEENRSNDSLQNDNISPEATTGVEKLAETETTDSVEQEDEFVNEGQEESQVENDWEVLKVVADGYYDDMEVENGHCYAYTICCVNDSDEDISSFDPEGRAITFFDTPQDISLSNTESGVNIRWNQIEGVYRYRIYRRVTPVEVADNDVTEADGSEEVTTESKNDLTSSAENDDSTESIANLEASKETQEIPPETVSTELVEDVGKEKVGDSPASNDWEFLADVETEQYDDTSVENNISYDYTISCLDSDSTEEISAHDSEGRSIRFYSVPRELKTASVKDGINITWSPVEGISAYQVYRMDEGGVFQPLSTSESTEYTDTDVSGGQTYRYTVGCMDAEKTNVISAFDSTGNEIIYIKTPDGLNVQNIAGGVSFKWNKSEGAEKYRIIRKNPEGTWEKVSDSEENIFVDSNVTNGEEYTYSVCCVDKEGTNEISSYDSEGTAIVFFDAPGELQAVNIENGVKVSWKGLEGIVAYQIYRTDDSGEFQKLAISDTAEYIDNTVQSGHTYNYTVSCMNQNKTAEVSAFDHTGKDILYISAPGNINTQNTLKGISISWDKSEGAVNYQVLRKNKDGNWEKLSDTNKQSIVDKDVKSGKKYLYNVKCVNKDGTQDMSSFNQTGKTQVFLSPIIEKKVKVKNKEDGISISWPKITGANSYVIYRGASEESLKPINTVTGEEQADYFDQKTKDGESYIYAVQASCKYKDGEAVGAYTGKKAVRLKGTQIESLDAKTEAFTVKWEGNDKASYYEIQYGTDKSFKKKSRTVSAPGDKRSKTIRDLNVEKYYVRVRACTVIDDKDYFSAWTDAKTVTPKEEEISTYYETKTEPVSNKSTYIANINTKKFHEPYCRDLNRMKESNKKEYTATREEMIQMGYSPCGHCKP